MPGNLKQSNDLPAASVPEVRGSTRILGVFGWPVEHSLSPAMHNAALHDLGLDFIYVPFAVSPDALETAIRSLPALGIVGVNLTIPHKERVLPFLDEITSEAREVGAVNTVQCKECRLIGDNTDGRGFYRPLLEIGFEARGKQAFILGAGGAARSVAFQLARSGIGALTVANRSLERAEQLVTSIRNSGYDCALESLALDDTTKLSNRLQQADLLAQTTRVGMHPDSDSLPPLPLDALRPELLVYELVYNPVETRLLYEARRRGCRVLTGVKMLVYQGAASFERWTGAWPSTQVMETAVLKGLK